jgi:hypothetical protein
MADSEYTLLSTNPNLLVDEASQRTAFERWTEAVTTPGRTISIYLPATP